MPTASAGHETFTIAGFALESGAVLEQAALAYQTYGELDARRSNAVLFPTWFAGTHRDNEWLIGPGKPLDTDRYFVVVPNLFGNGVSSSPSNTAGKHHAAGFPRVEIRDNVEAQHRLLTEHLGIGELHLVIGCSMGAAQTYQWAVSHPAMVRRALTLCGSPRTSPHNTVFLEGLRAALTADGSWQGGAYDRPPTAGLRAFARIYAGWGLSQAFYWDHCYRGLGFSTLEDFLAGFWEANFQSYDANDLLTMMRTWQHADVGRTPGFDGDLPRALGTIKARVLSMPSARDLYFPPEDEIWANRHIPAGEVRTIPGIWGHLAGGGLDPTAAAFIGTAVRELLDA